ncbi:ABC transporter permease [Turneriella parva]|uniref:Transport permease protein n=1 Tax=Turneriella parva (strain ATCC BAA-1111 / DSM 21527 / NCTC 11395 / H) TaxID=869212 RepID=I4B116_TURPD|nr:ABC transporter permease [Turneriella parva]AFM10973.1 ABC-2 type transporter [Turneriella parva DSM 21527]
MSETNEQWDTVIRAERSWFSINWRELWKYRDLIYLFVRRDFVAFYKQTILGPLWYLIQPLFTTLIFTVVFSRLASIPTDGVPPLLFYLAGLVLWNYFSECLTSTSSTFLDNQGIFGKVYFPRLSIPISVVLSKLIKLAIQLMLLSGIYVYFWFSGQLIRPSPWLLVVLPLLVLQIALLGLGTGIFISSLTTKYRDLNYLVGFGVQLWMYATPIIYPISQVPEKYRIFVHLNPVAQVVTNFRFVLFGGADGTNLQPALGNNLLVSLSTTMVILLLGLFLFSRTEKSFIDTI